MKENKTDIIKIRVSKKEKEEIQKKAKEQGYRISSFIRRAVLNEKIPSKTDIQVVFELKKIGTNLNQLAKHVNGLPVEENIKEAGERIESYIKELKQITDKLI